MNFNFTHVEFTWNTQNIQKQKISRETTNLTIKDLGIWGVKKVAMLNWLLFSMFFFSFSCHWSYRNVLVFPEKIGVVYRVFFPAGSTWIILTFFTVSRSEHWCISVVSQILFARAFHLQCVEAQGTIWCCYLFFTLYLFHWVKWISREPQARKMQKKNTKKRVTNTSLLTAIAFFFSCFGIRGSHFACTLDWFQKIKKIREQATL